MNHIEEMMKTAGVSKVFYRDFTAEKQIELIKLIAKTLIFFSAMYNHSGEYDLCINGISGIQDDFTQALAQFTTELIKAGELDKQKVKEILEE